VSERALPLQGPPQQVVLTRRLSVPEQLARAVWRSRGRQQGKLAAGALERLGPIEILQRQLRLDRGRLERFREVCADRGGAEIVPACFLQSLFLGPMAAIMLHPRFPLNPLGLVHLRQRFDQLRPVGPDERLELRCHLAELRETDRGLETDCGMELRSGEELVWQGLATLLSRNRNARSGSRKRAQHAASGNLDGDVKLIEAPANTGLRYAAASRDYNPHHLYPMTARLVGFKRPIAHGMWTLARALSELGGTAPEARQLKVEAAWKRPVFLPGRVAVRADEGDPRSEAGLAFEVFHPERGEPHLKASVHW